jgi:hypothetical protein
MRERMLRIAEALSEQETIAKRRVRRRGHRGRGTVLIIGMMVVACFWAVGRRAGMGPTSATAGEVELGTGLELAVDEASLAGIIRRYYARVPGGMAAALRSAREAAGRKFLGEFPRLRYDAIFEVVPVSVESIADQNRPGGLRVLGYYSVEEGKAYVRSSQPTEQMQLVKEHELTHAWQYAGDPAAEVARKEQWTGQFRCPLGDGDRHRERLEQMNWQTSLLSIGLEDRYVQYMRGYMARPIEIDPRLAAFKRWWALDHGELLDTAEKVRTALEHARLHGILAGRDAVDVVSLWHSFRDQPRIQQMLQERMVQLI